MCFSLFFGSFKFLFVSNKKKQDITRVQKQMDGATSFVDWENAALEMDTLTGKEWWKNEKHSTLYDTQIIEFWLNHYKSLSKSGDYVALASAIRSGLHRNIGGIANTRLFDYSLVGTKRLIEDFYDEAINHLEYICCNDIEGFPLERKLDFFYELRKSYGKSALLLSGGATMGMFHIGVMKALYEEHLLPQIISGTSAGSFTAALMCILSDDELEQLFTPPYWGLGDYDDVSLWRKFTRFLTTGYFMDSKQFSAYIRDRLGDVTFKEAYDKSKRILCISVASTQNFERPALLNYITAPNVLIWSAVCASCALPLAFEPVELMSKDKNKNVVPYYPTHIKWRDGSIGADLPMNRLSELFNVNHFLVSQVNPHVAPFLRHTEMRKGGFRWTLIYFIKSELRHRTKQLAELGLMKGFLTTIEPVLTQTYHGDVTIVPPFSVLNYLNLFSNPMEKFIGSAIEQGRTNTFPKIPIIRNHCLIEQTLENCCERLKAELYQKSNQSNGNGIGSSNKSIHRETSLDNN